MTTIHLPEFWIERLARMPESGMGYQKVDITLKNGRVIHDLIILNSEDCEVPEAFDPADIIDVTLHSHD